MADNTADNPTDTTPENPSENMALNQTPATEESVSAEKVAPEKSSEEIPVLTGNPDPSNLCEYLYVSASPIATFSNKDLSDRFLTTLILSLIVCLANIGLAIFGILLFKNPEDDKLSKFETVQSKI